MNRQLVLIFLFLFCISSCANSQNHNDKEKYSHPNKEINFDEIIFTTSECMLPCPVTNIIISADGSVVFKGEGNSTKKGLYVGKISKELFLRFENNFRKANIDALKSKYQSMVSDRQTQLL
jgi:hypothetical protein